VKSLSPHAQTWAQQRRVCRPAQPLRIGDGFKYHTAASHDNATLFRRRMNQRIREASNAQPT
jgi:hypothetical protein